MRRRIQLEAVDTEDWKKLWLLVLATLGVEIGALWWSLRFLAESWMCQTTGASGTDYSEGVPCLEARSWVDCRSVGSPVSVNFRSEGMRASVVCPWDRGAAELRICVLVLAAVMTLQAALGVSRERKTVVQSSVFGLTYVPLFLILTTLFDYSTDPAPAQLLCSTLGLRAADTVCELDAVRYTAILTAAAAVLSVTCIQMLLRTALQHWERAQPSDDL